MATIKSYTDLEQSKKLAEILPLESADMFLALNGLVPVMSKYIDDGFVTAVDTAIPCWSLAALHDSLPNNKHISTTVSRGGWSIEAKDYMPNTWWCEYEDNEDYTELSTSADNQIDACYEMIIKLYEQKLL